VPIDGMPKVIGWAAPPKTLGEALADEVYRVCLDHGVEPIRLDVREKERFELAVELWGKVSDG
jgi:hypothetical protein